MIIIMNTLTVLIIDSFYDYSTVITYDIYIHIDDYSGINCHYGNHYHYDYEFIIIL